MKKITILVFLFTVVAFSQKKSVNNYKYVVVPETYDFLKSKNQYQVNDLTKFLFKKYGFIAFYSSNNLPKDFQKDRCSALYADVKKLSGFLTLKLQVELKDCDNKVIFISKVGRSKEKEYKKAYHESLRRAFISLKELNYSYVSLSKNEVEIVKVQPKVEETKKEIITNYSVLYAQPKEYGFQLVDTKPSIVFQIETTGKKDVFILKNKKGIFYKNNTEWIAEFYENNVKQVKKYQLKM